MKITKISNQENKTFEAKMKLKKLNLKQKQMLEEVALATTGLSLASVSAKTAFENQGEIYAPTLAITSAYSAAIGAGGLAAATLDSTKINENKKEKLLNKIMSAVLPLGFASIGGAVSVLNPNDYELVSKGLATTSGGLVSGLTMKSNFDDKKSKDLPS